MKGGNSLETVGGTVHGSKQAGFHNRQKELPCGKSRARTARTSSVGWKLARKQAPWTKNTCDVYARGKNGERQRNKNKKKKKRRQEEEKARREGGKKRRETGEECARDPRHDESGGAGLHARHTRTLAHACKPTERYHTASMARANRRSQLRTRSTASRANFSAACER